MNIIELTKFFFLTSFIAIAVYNLSLRFNFLYDSKIKKFHTGKALNIGGIIILINILVSIYFFEFPKIVNNFLVFSFPLFFLGFLDDIKAMSPTSRIFIQFFVIYFAIVENQLEITNLGSYEYISIIELGTFSKIFTSLCVILIINSSNYNDGIDGWSNINFINSNICLLILIIFFNKIDLFNIPIILIISTSFVLFLNFGFVNKKKVFLGNGGSLLLGYLISFEVLFFNQNIQGIHPIIFAAILGYNVYEFLAVNLNRLYLKKNIFVGGRDHFHYLIYYYFGRNNIITLIILSFVQVFLASAIILIFYFIGAIFALLAFVCLFLIFFIIRQILFKNFALIDNQEKQ